MLTKKFTAQAICLTAFLVATLGGCVITVDPGPGEPNDGDPNTPPVTPTTITVRIINATNRTLDPEIYTTDQPLAAGELFEQGEKFTAYGVGRLGLLAGQDTDQFTLPCDQVRIIGTPGGLFGGGSDGNDLTNPAGQGRQRILTQDNIFACGERITFTYSESGGVFTTQFVID